MTPDPSAARDDWAMRASLEIYKRRLERGSNLDHKALLEVLPWLLALCEAACELADEARVLCEWEREAFAAMVLRFGVTAKGLPEHVLSVETKLAAFAAAAEKLEANGGA